MERWHNPNVFNYNLRTILNRSCPRVSCISLGSFDSEKMGHNSRYLDAGKRHTPTNYRIGAPGLLLKTQLFVPSPDFGRILFVNQVPQASNQLNTSSVSSWRDLCSGDISAAINILNLKTAKQSGVEAKVVLFTILIARYARSHRLNAWLSGVFSK